MKNKDREAELWVNTAVLELKSTYIELIYPLSLLVFKECRDDKLGENFATNGRIIYYHPERIKRHTVRELKRQLLHILAHGLLGHFEKKELFEQKCERNLLMDLQANYLLKEWGIENDYNHLTYRKLEEFLHGDYSLGGYRRLCEAKRNGWPIKYYKNLLQVDNHEWWNVKDKEECKLLWEGIRGTLLLEEDINKDGRIAMGTLADVIAGKSRKKNTCTFKVGKGSGRNYRELLEKLLKCREISAEEPESIDTMLYQYGLELYDNVPILEPAETSLPVMNGTFAIAVDVSGSCASEERMKAFWGETYNCLSQAKNYCKEGKVVLLQCDDAIRKEQIVKLREWKKTPEQVLVEGSGGTSFVPVFERLEELEKNGCKIDALFYLTDGQGIYPTKKPDYPVYFIIPKEEEGCFEVPEWIHWITL